MYVAGGDGSDGSSGTAAVYNPAGDGWSGGKQTLTTRRAATTQRPCCLPARCCSRPAMFSAARTSLRIRIEDPVNDTVAEASSLITPRYGPTATLLNSGKVVIAGGFGTNGKLASAELFDAANGTYTVTAVAGANGSVALPTQIVNGGGHRQRHGHTWLWRQHPQRRWRSVQRHADRCNHVDDECDHGRLQDNGKLSRFDEFGSLYAHGHAARIGKSIDRGRLQQPGCRSVRPRQQDERRRHDALDLFAGYTATLLPSGKVLVAGARTALATSSQRPSSTPIRANNTWSAGGSLSFGRFGHAAALLTTGKVLVVGSDFGGPVEHAELYNPATNLWSAAASPGFDRSVPTATVLPGRARCWSSAAAAAPAICTIRQQTPGAREEALPSAYAGRDLAGVRQADQRRPRWRQYPRDCRTLLSGRQQLERRNEHGFRASEHTATLLGTGKVLVLGGYNGAATANAEAGAEVYDLLPIRGPRRPASSARALGTRRHCCRQGRSSSPVARTVPSAPCSVPNFTIQPVPMRSSATDLTKVAWRRVADRRSLRLQLSSAPPASRSRRKP